MKLLIDAKTGTILNVDDCYIVDADTLSDTDKALLDDGNDTEVGEVAQRTGTSVTEIGKSTGWGDNKYAWTVSYSPLSLRDEAQVYVEGGIYENGDPEWDALVWATTATAEELSEVSAWIMSNDSVWEGFRNNFTTELVAVYNKLKEDK